jgi:hypothetical protein
LRAGGFRSSSSCAGGAAAPGAVLTHRPPAPQVDEPAVWSELAHAQLQANLVPDAIASYLRCSDTSTYLQVRCGGGGLRCASCASCAAPPAPAMRPRMCAARRPWALAPPPHAHNPPRPSPPAPGHRGGQGPGLLRRPGQVPAHGAQEDQGGQGGHGACLRVLQGERCMGCLAPQGGSKRAKKDKGRFGGGVCFGDGTGGPLEGVLGLRQWHDGTGGTGGTGGRARLLALACRAVAGRAPASTGQAQRKPPSSARRRHAPGAATASPASSPFPCPRRRSTT